MHQVRLDPEERGVDDRLVVGFRKLVTRRTMLGRVMRWTLGAGTATAVSFKFASEAEASNCSYYGAVGTWGCYCAGTANCPSSVCSNGNVVAYHKRCTYWTQPNSVGQYCWCSQTCYQGSNLGKYVCCDGFVEAASGCNRSGTPCICRWWIPS
jgi:hypothetical protein